MLCLISAMTMSGVQAQGVGMSTEGPLVADSKPAASTAKAGKPVVKKAPVRKKPAAKSKSRKTAEVIATPVPQPKLDLSLPKDMVKNLKPPTQPVNAAASTDPAAQKPILPAFFSDKGNEDFQLNGRLLNNEMQLQQRRNDGREVEGAALDFQFKQ